MIVPTPWLYDLSHIYPESDGLPMADNTTQYRWMVTIKGGLDIQYGGDANVFVAGDLFWYPVEGHPEIRVASDVLVALGRPRGERRSYLQWMEDNVAPQVVFEILSPGNTPREMDNKREFYQRYGVEEYYVYDPDERHLEGWQRSGALLAAISTLDGWVSPRLGIRFDLSARDLRIFSREGELFVDPLGLATQRDSERQQKEQARQRAEQERQRAEQERQRAEQERQRAEQERQEKERAQQRETEAAARAERLAAQLRALGIEPEQ